MINNAENNDMVVKINSKTVWKFLFFAMSAILIYTQIFGIVITPLAALGKKISGTNAGTGAKISASTDGSKVQDDVADLKAVVLPASGWLMMAKVRRRWTSIC